MPKYSELPPITTPSTDAIVSLVQSGVTSRTPASAFFDNMEVFTQSTTGALPRPVNKKLDEWISVKDFGVKGDGVTDDTTNFNLAITKMNAAGGGVLLVPRGTYIITSTILMNSNVTVFCEEGAVIDLEGHVSGNSVEFTGTVGSEFAFTAAKTRGDVTIQLSGSPGFAVGDVVHLVSYASVFAAGEYNLGYHPTDNCYFSEWNIIAEDLGGGSYRLAIPFEFPGWTTSSKAKKVTPLENAHWIGGRLNRKTNGTSSNAIFCGKWAYHCTVRDCVTERGSHYGVTLRWDSSWFCEGRNIRNINDPTYKFVYSVDHSFMNRFKTIGSQDCGFVGLDESFGGQSIDFTYSSSTQPYSNVRSYCRDSSFYRCFEGVTSHYGCYSEQWTGNKIIDCHDDGMVVRGYAPVILNNIITSTVDITDSLTFTAGSFILGSQYTIASAGTTNFVAIGAADNNVGTVFVATGVGTGTGTATLADTYGIRLGYGGPRRADVGNNMIRGFYGGIGFYGSSTLGYWTTILANIHDNEISHCFVGMSAVDLGNTNDMRYITYQNNRHSYMGKQVVSIPEYTAGVTVKGNVLDGDFRYSGSGVNVSFVEASQNCPALVVTDNLWRRSKGGNAGKNKYFVIVGSPTDLTLFPEADWAAQSFFQNNIATYSTDSLFVYYSIGATNYHQTASVLPDVYLATISSGVAKAIPSPSRVFYVNLTTEGGAGTDDLDTLQPYTNCFFQEGDVVYLRSLSSVGDVVIRDVSTTLASNYGFQTPGNASITLGTSNDIVCCLFAGIHWSVVSSSLNG